MDSFVGAFWTGFSFKTEPELQPWFQVAFTVEVRVKRVIVVQRIDADGEQFANVSLTLGNTSAQMSDNPEIAFFSGPSQTGRIDVIPCTMNIDQRGKYFVMQKKTTDGQKLHVLTFAEILIYIDEDLCVSETCGRYPDPEYYANPRICSVWGEEQE